MTEASYKPGCLDVSLACLNIVPLFLAGVWTYLTIWTWLVVPVFAVPLTYGQMAGLAVAKRTFLYLHTPPVECKDEANFYSEYIVGPYVRWSTALFVAFIVRAIFY